MPDGVRLSTVDVTRQGTTLTITTRRSPEALVGIPFAGLGSFIVYVLAAGRPEAWMVVVFGGFGMLFLVVGVLTLYRYVLRRHVLVVDTAAGTVTEPGWLSGRRTALSLSDVAGVSVKRHWHRYTGTTWDAGLDQKNGGRLVLALREGRGAANDLADLARRHLYGPR